MNGQSVYNPISSLLLQGWILGIHQTSAGTSALDVPHIPDDHGATTCSLEMDSSSLAFGISLPELGLSPDGVGSTNVYTYVDHPHATPTFLAIPEPALPRWTTRPLLLIYYPTSSVYLRAEWDDYDSTDVCTCVDHPHANMSSLGHTFLIIAEPARPRWTTCGLTVVPGISFLPLIHCGHRAKPPREATLGVSGLTGDSTDITCRSSAVETHLPSWVREGASSNFTRDVLNVGQPYNVVVSVHLIIRQLGRASSYPFSVNTTTVTLDNQCASLDALALSLQRGSPIT
ncbi:hypothetical protein NEOLEDRAFT_1169839 [Neolentinus lepideus HHB14362 ss-1]|uniref:Uncharacterized protein n=1 Tax=Neolentinus lepideus HHB14362 ss-1 TaxID=1314782 RepID=A0A165S803_9AGAM|nr:hypothetical protein NEOLEDRAFT_1169839 [Neolentinus lepideus HHB14362 ss-1]